MGGYQLIDLVLATMHVLNIQIKTFQLQTGQADAQERNDIESLKPQYNIAMNGNLYTCLCDPAKRIKQERRSKSI